MNLTSQSLIQGSPSRSASIAGGARLRYAFVDGQTRLLEQWARPPLHVSKCYQESSWAISQLTSPTAGLFEGDSINQCVEVGPGGKAAVISPAACRVHTMETGSASVKQSYTVAEGGWLDVWPAPLILQRASRLKQSTAIEVAEGGSLLFTEMITPGRGRHGEAFEFAEWRSRLTIRHAGRLVALEQYRVRPEDGDVADWRNLYPEGPYACIYFIGLRLDEEWLHSCHALSIPCARIGSTIIRQSGVGIKILAANGVALRKAILAVRDALLARQQQAVPAALRRAQTFF